MHMQIVVTWLVFLVSAQALPTAQRAVVVTGEAPKEGDWSTLKMDLQHSIPEPGQGQVLIRVHASSVNPIDWKILYGPFWGKWTSPKVIGFDVSGQIAKMGPGCTRLKMGDDVWADMGKGLGSASGVELGAWAEYVVADESQVGLKPTTMSYLQAASLPLVGMTDLQAFKMPNMSYVGKTVVITSGSGGTGVPAIQMAKAYGATRIITASSSANAERLKALGATDVIDYHTTKIWDVIPSDSVDFVYDNLGAPGTADAAMDSIRPHGAFVFLPGKGGDISHHPNYKSIKQFNFGIVDASRYENLDELKDLVDKGHLGSPLTTNNFMLTDFKKALDLSVSGHVFGKIGLSIDPADSESILI